MENEHVDPAYKYIDDKIKPIKRELQQLKEAQDIVGFQGQITSLNEKITNLETILLETRRFLAQRDIEDLRLFLEQWISNNLLSTVPPRPITLPASSLYQEVHEFLLTASAAAQQAVVQSSAPISVTKKFTQNCQEYFKSHNLQAFRQ